MVETHPMGMERIYKAQFMLTMTPMFNLEIPRGIRFAHTLSVNSIHYKLYDWMLNSSTILSILYIIQRP